MRLPRLAPPPLAPGIATQWMMAALVALGPLSLTMYQPALPAIATSLNATPGRIQLTLTVYLVAYAFGQLFLGPLSDEFGRRRTLLIGLATFAAGSLMCSLSGSVGTLIAARALQGFAACAGPALSSAMIRDVYGSAGTARAMAFVASALSIAPTLAPLIGGYLASFVGWPSIFDVLTAVGVVLFGFVLFRIPETNLYMSDRAFSLGRLFGNYMILIVDRVYLGFLAITAAGFAGFLAFQTAASFIIVGDLGVAPSTYGWLLSTLPIAYFIGTLLGARLAHHWTLERTVVVGAALFVLGPGIQLTCALMGLVSVTTLISSQMLWGLGSGIAMPRAMAGAVIPFPTMAGTAVGLQGFSMMTAGAMTSLLLSLIPVAAVSLGAVMLAIAVTGAVVYVWAVRP